MTTVEEAERAWLDAMSAETRDDLAALLHPEFRAVHGPVGFIHDAHQFLADAETSAARNEHPCNRVRDPHVRRHGGRELPAGDAHRVRAGPRALRDPSGGDAGLGAGGVGLAARAPADVPAAAARLKRRFKTYIRHFGCTDVTNRDTQTVTGSDDEGDPVTTPNTPVDAGTGYGRPAVFVRRRGSRTRAPARRWAKPCAATGIRSRSRAR